MKLELQYKKIMLISAAFFSILMLWQIYNTYCPLFIDSLLSHKMENEQERAYIIGIIMATDNILALFMLPLFGHISDRTKSRFGKRKPYIVSGMILAAIAFPFIAVFYIYNNLAGVIIMMGLILLIMHMFRTPAVSLMPDITPKPLRSKANGIINLIGYIGPILAGVLVILFKSDENPVIPFVITSAAMVGSCLVLILYVKERQLVDEMQGDILKGEELSQSLDEVGTDTRLSKGDRRNFLILLIAVFLWFMSFNAVESFMSLYCQKILKNESIAGTGVIILTFASIATFIPSGMFSNKIGRKNSVLIGLATLILGFCILVLFREAGLIFYIAVAICGVGWAMINVNSYPMICEMAHQGNIGKLSGYYYTASMFAQSVTPILLGFLMSFFFGYGALFVYAMILMIISLGVFMLFKENKKVVSELKKGLELFDLD